MSELHALTLRNDRAEVGRMMTWIDQVVAPFDLSPRTMHALQLCLEEAVTNIVSYAFEPETTHDVHIAVWRDGTGLHAEVTDNGRPFDPLAHQVSAPAKDLQSAQVGGLGIKLMRSFANGIAYQRTGMTNRLTLSFPIP